MTGLTDRRVALCRNRFSLYRWIYNHAKTSLMLGAIIGLALGYGFCMLVMISVETWQVYAFAGLTGMVSAAFSVSVAKEEFNNSTIGCLVRVHVYLAWLDMLKESNLPWNSKTNLALIDRVEALKGENWELSPRIGLWPAIKELLEPPKS
jgi:hypothetical protein